MYETSQGLRDQKFYDHRTFCSDMALR
uniref:Uncharacterized protein n=1 Tax=Physcomitrium patens TaxID=3218 RepID=A0A2K1L2F8_PHYPA|nr:hypothetical protein PHYPA_002994 [Physcomitrium patens]